MYTKSCRCGKQTKNFKKNIGEFFIDECCTEAGYDHLGKKALNVKDLGLDQSKIDETINTQAANLEILDEGEQPDPNEEVSSETPSEETDEEYAENLEAALKEETEEEVSEEEVSEELPPNVVERTTVTMEVQPLPGETQEQTETRVADAVLNGEPAPGKVVEIKTQKRKRNPSGNLKKQEANEQSKATEDIRND